jgi:hypothetical protein
MTMSQATPAATRYAGDLLRKAPTPYAAALGVFVRPASLTPSRLCPKGGIPGLDLAPTTTGWGRE